MCEFRKYKSIENHYRQKAIEDMFKFNPVYCNCRYIVQEKVDGGNFQVRLTIDDSEPLHGVKVDFGKRSSILGESEQFYNYQAVVSDFSFVRFLDKACKVFNQMLSADESMKEMIFYGEIFGPGIQSRINYGDTKKILFYDIRIDNEYLTQEEFIHLMEDVLVAKEFMVPIVGIYNSFEEAYAVEVEGVKTMINPDGDRNLWEGVVIKPFDVIAINKDDEQVLFYVKKKTDKFKDQMKVKSRDRKKDIPSELIDAQEIFESFLTENRLMDLFGKHGPIERVDQIGEYVKLMLNDAKEDFFKNYSVVFGKVPDRYKNMVFSTSGKIVSKMLFKHV